ncbi:MAG: MCE family protein [Propionibacteriales bacterium]|nr:MCE family protein [Propionibacteriales bacterium]
MTRRLLTAAVVLLLVGAGLMLVRSGGTDDRTLVAMFPRTTSLYAGSQVKVLGVKVGKVDAITVKGTSVEVRISYDGDVELPADVHALIVPPSIVGDRFIQLAPAYEDGEVLADKATLGLDRTGVPVELDETYSALDKFATGLGPEGANADGALSRLVTATAKNLSGHGAAFNQTLREFSDAISTLAGSSGDISDTVANLEALTGTLQGKDAQLRQLVTNLARVGTQLSSQRNEISSSVTELQEALGLVARFAADNRGALKESITGLTTVSGVLSRRSRELGNLISLVPVGLTNLANIYIPKNWDPSKPWLTKVDGRAGSANLRGAIFDDLDTQLGFTLGAVCAGLPAEQQVQLAAFCGALTDAGGSLGAVLSQAIEQGSSGVAARRGSTSLSGMMGGGS